MTRPYSFSPSAAPSLAVGLQLIEGVDAFSVFGKSPELLEDQLTDLSGAIGTAVIPLPLLAGQDLEIVSSNGADITEVTVLALGPGATEIDPIVLNLTGIVPVPLGSLSRIQSVVVTGDTPVAGSISVRPLGGGSSFAVVSVVAQQTSTAMYTIPAGRVGLISTIIGTMSKTGGQAADVELFFRVKRSSQSAFRSPFSFGLQRNGDTSVQFQNQYPQGIRGPADLKLSATASADGAFSAGWMGGVITKG